MYDIFRIDNDLYEINERDDNEQYSICKKTDIGIYNYGKELDMAIAEILKGYKILFRIKQNSFFDGESEVIIFDREIDNLQIREWQPRYSLIEPKMHTLPKKKIDEIKRVIQSSKYLFNENDLEESNHSILDGTGEEIYFGIDEKIAYFNDSNILLEYEDFSRDTKAGELVYVCKQIESLLHEGGYLKWKL